MLNFKPAFPHLLNIILSLLSLLFCFFFLFAIQTFLKSCLIYIFSLNRASPFSRHLSGHQKASEPRTPRCGWDVRVRSPRDPAEVVLALREAAQGCGCQVHLAGPFLLSCTHGVAGARVAFEAEVCQLPSGLGQSSGVRFKRLWGAPLAFRDIATKVSKELELWGWQEVRQIDDKQDNDESERNIRSDSETIASSSSWDLNSSDAVIHVSPPSEMLLFWCHQSMMDTNISQIADRPSTDKWAWSHQWPTTPA